MRLWLYTSTKVSSNWYITNILLCQSEAQINLEGCSRNGIRHNTFSWGFTIYLSTHEDRISKGWEVEWLQEWKDNSMLAKPLAACTHLSSTVSQLFEPQMQKIAVFTYRSPHFCFPWRRRCDYHAICCMNGKTIQCLPNPSQHVPIYLQ